MRYNNLSEFFRKRYGRRLDKICIDGGFTCPNRDGKCGYGGCIFCGERGSGEWLDKNEGIRETAKRVIERGHGDEKYVAYFQNFTNTYAPIEVLKERYDSALISDRIVALAIGTRPDCIDEDVCRLLATYTEKYDVWVELGLQSANDETAEIINRGYKTEQFEKAVKLLEKYGIWVVAHVIVGLPGETDKDVLNTVDYLKRFSLFGIKIHSIYVTEGTLLAKMYREKRYTPPTLDEFCDVCVEIIARLPKSWIIHRLTGDAPKDLLIAPEWNADKNAIYDALRTRMKAQNVRQGIRE
jgi:radical SAM protein (TIGR01212 family)